MKLVPFTMEHYLALKEEAPITPAAIYFGQDLVALLKWSLEAPSFTGLIDGQPVGAAGVWPMWQGVAEAWAIIGRLGKKYPLALQKALKTGIEDICHNMQIHRLQSCMALNDPHGQKWLKSLGFKDEGVMRSFSPAGDDYIRYARIFKR